MKKLLIITCYDSFLKASFNVAEVFKRNQYRIHYFIYKDFRDLDTNHFHEIGFEYSYQSGWLRDLFRTNEIFDFDAIMLSMEGPAIYKFYQLYAGQIHANYLKRRPILFGGYVGIVYENFMQGFMDRQPIDVYYVNCQHDLEMFKEYCKKLKLDSDNLFLTGLPMLDMSYNQRFKEAGKSKSLLFAGQPTVPKSFRERSILIKKMIEYARTHEDETIYFKPRHKPSQSTFHMAMFHYEDIYLHLKRNIQLPSNFILTYEPILDLLQKVDLCLTVSSTAAFEALCMGIPVGFLADFGISEKYGNHYFADSGCLLTIDRLNLKNIPKLDADWEKRYFKCNGRNTENVFEAVDRMVENQQHSETMLPLRRYFKGELLGDYRIGSNENLHKTDAINKIAHRLMIKTFRLLSKISPIIYSKLLS